MPLIPALAREMQTELCEFQASESYIMRPCVKKEKKKEENTNKNWGKVN